MKCDLIQLISMKVFKDGVVVSMALGDDDGYDKLISAPISFRLRMKISFPMIDHDI